MAAPRAPDPAARPYRIAVLASGRGSNLQALIDAAASQALPATLVGVFSDRADALALERARGAGIPALALDPGAFPSRAAFDLELFAQIDAAAPDLVVCAGYMRLLGAAPVEARAGRLVNIHPSLLPAFKGLRTHRRALEAGAREHGASIHFVTADLDGGPVVSQARVPVLAGDDAATLGTRVLAREHPLLVETVRLLAAGRVVLHERRIHLDGRALAAPLQLASNNRFA
ncbi:phosphoribosylglycinamide formyltransferase [Luteimonas sp. SJ-92]|uniref:Phosphoribosylglycinamide formyltransferase n=1 Tax=Luteimonas salinisoli TaxID=2752307 RepID=A0A853JDT8_9GAMM|nr:phosphoribosylglycinamide formyltransferase [Luteimonas salinisoli]NZA27483.1 phosphoribosylglycinamide formyltransferase [Luteimonas salinisoli]